MKRSIYVPLLVVVASSFVWNAPRVWTAETKDTAASKEDESDEPRNITIALVDVRYILENQVSLKQDLDKLKVKSERLNEQAKSERARIHGLERQLVEFRPGTPDYYRLEESIAIGKVKVEHITRRLPNERAKIFEKAYIEIQNEVRTMMRENNISAVINFDGSVPPESAITIASLTAPRGSGRRCSFTYEQIKQQLQSFNPVADVDRRLNTFVVANDLSIDITPHILNRLNPRPFEFPKEASKRNEGGEAK